MNNEEYQKSFEKIGKQKIKNPSHKYFGEKTSRVFYHLVKKYINEPVLDVGAGTGALKKLKKLRL